MLSNLLSNLAKWFIAFWRLILSIILLLLCVFASWEGISLAVYSTKCDADGGRGGAVAVAMALFVIFFTPSNASDLYRKFSNDNVDPTPGDQNARFIVRSEIRRLLKLLDRDSKLLLLQNFILAASSVIGTLAWGFGDMIAKSLLQKHGLPHCHL